MGLYNRLCYWFGDSEVITHIEIIIEFLSSSGDVIFITNNKQKINKSRLYNSSKWLGFITDLENKNREHMNNVAMKELKRARRGKFIKLHSGCSVSGKHIVMSRWSLRPKFKEVSYKEYTEIKNGPK